MALAMILMGGSQAQAYTVTPPSSVSTHYASVVMQLVNEERAERGLRPYGLSVCARSSAEWWATRLAQTGYFYHQWMGNIWNACDSPRAGEDLARGFNHATTLVAAWMASPGHRAVILDPCLREIGVAARYANGKWVVVADFAQ